MELKRNIGRVRRTVGALAAAGAIIAGCDTMPDGRVDSTPAFVTPTDVVTEIAPGLAAVVPHTGAVNPTAALAALEGAGCNPFETTPGVDSQITFVAYEPKGCFEEAQGVIHEQKPVFSPNPRAIGLLPGTFAVVGPMGRDIEEIDIQGCSVEPGLYDVDPTAREVYTGYFDPNNTKCLIVAV